MKKALLFLLAFSLGFFFIGGSPPIQAASKSRPAISRITIRGTDIFDLETKTNLDRFPYTFINFLHIQTKEYVIRRELLFKVGDPLDVFLLRESERNLRGLSFIRAARVMSFPQRDGTVALVVHVNDAWTTEPQINVSGTNGISKVEIGFKEKNLFGLGKTLSYFHNKTEDVTENTFNYFDPQLLGTHWQFSADDIQGTDRQSKSFTVNRPFYATDVRWSAGSSYINESEDVEQFSDNVKVSEFKQSRESAQVSAGTKLGNSRNVVNHAGLRYLKVRTNAEPNEKSLPGQVLPPSNIRQTVFLDLETFRNRFVEMTQLEKMTRVEDINLGAHVKVSPGYSPTDLTGKEATTDFNGSFEKYTQAQSENLLYSLFKYSSRNTFDKPENERFNFTLKYYYRKWTRQTWVFHNRVEWGENLDSDNLIELGGANGLRAFKNVAFVGSKSLLFNLEDRLYFWDDLWDLVSVGGVVFYDSGYIWESGHPVALSDLRSDAGVGLRFGLTHSSNEVVIRTDIAYRMQRTNGDSPGWVLTFGSSQAF